MDASPAFHLHLISDSTGETVSAVARAALAQFDHIDMREHNWSMVRTPGQLKKALDGIRAHPGFVMHTLAGVEHRRMLHDACAELNVPCVSLLSRVVSDLSGFLGMEPSNMPGRRYVMDKEYFSRVEAINYSIAHDDGQILHDLDEADIILVGVSRTSKSPTSMYLAHWGYRTANVPYVGHAQLPPELLALKNAFVVGLTIRPESLAHIRRNRLLSLEQKEETTYTMLDEVEAEVAEARRFFVRRGWPVIDVTKRSVEETAAAILQLYRETKGANI
ncbi:MAG: pyruvate, water dikinase regulatory protein [Rickettsiales bacterium]